MTSLLPSKLFFRIGEVASLVGVEPHVLRYWERECRSIRPTKSAKGQRVYSRKDVENLLRVRDLLYRDGFTIAGAKKRLQRGGLEPGAVATTALQSETLLGQTDQEAESETDGERDPESDGEEDDRESESDHDDPPLRQKLTALRAEVEAFLGELETEVRSEKRSEPA